MSGHVEQVLRNVYASRMSCARGIFLPEASIKLHAFANSETESGRVFKGENREESVAGQRRFNKISLSYGLASFKEYRGAYLPEIRPGWTTANIYSDERARNSKYDYPGVASRVLEVRARSGRSIFAYYIRRTLLIPLFCGFHGALRDQYRPR